MQEIKIRKARLQDISAIVSVIAHATGRGKVLKRSKTDIGKVIRHFWVADDQGQIVACCALEIYNKKLAEVRSLAVSNAYENRGLASRLIEKVLAEAKRKKIYEVLAITDKETLFKRQGFTEQLHGQKPLFLRP